MVRQAERAAIAREMHDVLAHRLSLVIMHAGVLVYRTDLSPEQIKQTAQIVHENAAASLGELREILKDLRTEPTEKVPQPGPQALAELLDQARSSGTRLNANVDLNPIDAVPGPAGRHLYRIVQEALTNARKHAGEEISVDVVGTPGAGISLVVRNTLPQRPTEAPGAKLGLVGLHERAALVGGTLSAGSEGGEFVVRAWLPWHK